MREVILTANHQFFAEDLGEFFGEGVNHREQEFERIAVKWLIDNFGDDVVHAHADRDETAYHIHAVIVPRVRVDVGVHKNTAIRERLQPSKHELIRYYEKAQDSVGEAFAGLGLVRGERRRAAYREAMQAGQEPAPYRAHVKTRTWRMEQDLLLKEREAKVEAREADADAILMVAEAIAAGDVDPEATAEALGAGRVETVEDAPGITAANLDDEDAKAKLPEADRVVAKAGANPERLASVRKAVTRAPKATKRVFTAFGAAWKRLRGDAELQAEEGLRTAFDEVRAAEKEITRIASTLAPKERARITAARGSLGDRIRKLTLRFARSKVADDRNKPRRREDEQKGGKDQQ
ncbi:MAG: hypothetical protein KDK11_00345 [Maritimibacter sp.]|nr:hypothetical protein [Maritimibacter sp.]